MSEKELRRPDDFCSSQEVAGYWGISVEGLYESLRRGDCPVRPFRRRVGRREYLRWLRSEVLAVLEREGGTGE